MRRRRTWTSPTSGSGWKVCPRAHCALGGRRLGGNKRAEQSCQAHRSGLVISGVLHIEMDDGSTLDAGPNDVFDIPPGHDGWVVSDEPMRAVNWSGVRSWLPEPEFGDRVVATLLFTDIVGSTELASRVGDRAWRELLGRHNRAGRELGGKGLSGPRMLYAVTE